MRAKEYKISGLLSPLFKTSEAGNVYYRNVFQGLSNNLFDLCVLCRKDGNADPCSSCPTKKHHILRIIRSYGLFPSALKRASINGLDSGNDVKSLVPSLRKIEKKSRFGKVAVNDGEHLLGSLASVDSNTREMDWPGFFKTVEKEAKSAFLMGYSPYWLNILLEMHVFTGQKDQTFQQFPKIKGSKEISLPFI